MREEVDVAAEQFGFMLGRGTPDAVVALRQVMTRYREGWKPVQVALVDLEKVYMIRSLDRKCGDA